MSLNPDINYRWTLRVNLESEREKFTSHSHDLYRQFEIDFNVSIGSEWTVGEWENERVSKSQHHEGAWERFEACNELFTLTRTTLHPFFSQSISNYFRSLSGMFLCVKVLINRHECDRCDSLLSLLLSLIINRKLLFFALLFYYNFKHEDHF